MNKQEFLAQLRKRLSGLPREDMEERLTFYREMIEDRVEEGCSEEEAVSEIGPVEEIAAELPMNQPAAKKRRRAWEIVLLILGAPVWLSLLIAAFAVILSLYVSLWAVIISLWAVFGSLVGCAFGGIASGIGFLFGGYPMTGVAMIGAGILCAGLGIFLFFGCRAATKGTLLFTRKLVKRKKKEGGS